MFNSEIHGEVHPGLALGTHPLRQSLSLQVCVEKLLRLRPFLRGVWGGVGRLWRAPVRPGGSAPAAVAPPVDLPLPLWRPPLDPPPPLWRPPLDPPPPPPYELTRIDTSPVAPTQGRFRPIPGAR